MKMLLKFFSWLASFFKEKPEPLIVEDAKLPEDTAVSEELASVAPKDLEDLTPLTNVLLDLTKEHHSESEELEDKTESILVEEDVESRKKIVDFSKKKNIFFESCVQPIIRDRNDTEKRINLEHNYIKLHGFASDSAERLDNLFDEYCQLQDRSRNLVKIYKWMNKRVDEMVDEYYEHNQQHDAELAEIATQHRLKF